MKTHDGWTRWLALAGVALFTTLWCGQAKAQTHTRARPVPEAGVSFVAASRGQHPRATALGAQLGAGLLVSVPAIVLVGSVALPSQGGGDFAGVGEAVWTSAMVGSALVGPLLYGGITTALGNHAGGRGSFSASWGGATLGGMAGLALTWMAGAAHDELATQIAVGAMFLFELTGALIGYVLSNDAATSQQERRAAQAARAAVHAVHLRGVSIAPTQDGRGAIAGALIAF